MHHSTDVALAHGYTLADVHRLARQSAGTNRTMAADHRDLLDTAWSAIAEEIYTAAHWPTEHDLLAIGRAAIWNLVKDHRTVYGYRNREWDAGLATAPRFCAYWLGLRVMPSPEEPIVEHHTLPRLIAALGEPYRAAIVALATHLDNGPARALTTHNCGYCHQPWADHTDRDAAACSLDINRKAFDQRLRVARRACLALWLEHETPHRTKLRRLDRRVHRGEVAPCGTPAAVFRHRDRHEPLCELCAPVEVAYDRERKARRKAAFAA